MKKLCVNCNRLDTDERTIAQRYDDYPLQTFIDSIVAGLMCVAFFAS